MKTQSDIPVAFSVLTTVMTRVLIILFLILAGVSDGLGQNYIPYYNLVNEAEHNIVEHQYEAAAEKLYAAFEIEEPLAKDSYLLAYALDKIDAEAYHLEIVRWVLYCSNRSGRTMQWLDESPLSTTFEEPFYNSIRENMEVRSAQTKATADTVNYFVLGSTEMRTLFMDSIRVYYANSDSLYKHYQKAMFEEDSIRHERFTNYVLKSGYPGSRRGGGIAGIMLYEISLANDGRLKEKLYEELKAGYIYPYAYAAFIDRLANETEGAPCHGTNGTKCNLPKEEIIENRKRIGMSPYYQGTRWRVDVSKPILLYFGE